MPAAAHTVQVRGLRELNATFRKLDKTTQKHLTAELVAVGEPVRQAAEQLAVTNIRGIDDGDSWSAMRVGRIARAVYVAPKARRRKGTPRRNLAVLLLEQAMFPAVDQHEPEIVRRMDDVLDRLSRQEGF